MSFDIMKHREMSHLSPVDAATKTIRFVLERIIEDPTLGYLCGVGGQTWALLTEAHAMLNGVPVEDVRKNCIPKRAEDPRKTYGEVTPNSMNSGGEGAQSSGLRVAMFEEDEWVEYQELQDRAKALCESFASQECATAPHLASSAQHLDAIQARLESEAKP